MGAVVEAQGGHSLTVEAPAEIKPFRIFTGPHPGFPTDLQPQIAVAATQAQGVSVLIEAVFDQRFGYTSELRKLGADFKIRGKELKVYGPTPLLGAKLHASDLRAGAALVLAALAAEGQTIVGGIEHIDRGGYESMEEKLRQLGAKIVRVPD